VGLNVPEVIVSGGGAQARTEASISRVLHHTGGEPGFSGRSLTARVTVGDGYRLTGTKI